MFTGLVEFMAEVAEVVAERPGVRLVIREPQLAGRTKIGDSVALNGCCLTVVAASADRISFQAGEETLSRTNLGQLAAGELVNIEEPLKAGDPIGGHYVTGHVDGVGIVDQRRDDAEWSTMWIRAPADLMGQIASKGSIAVDGVSLTLVEVDRDRFSVALIPHTLSATTLGRRKVGDRVNLETDVLAKYVERQVKR
ncbi:MAG: riboflavin synthase [Pirellulales bacterium]